MRRSFLPELLDRPGVIAVREFWLFGQGISYTASPAIQAAALEFLGLPHRYVVHDVGPEQFEAQVMQLRGGTGGANVTIPYKAAAAALVDELSPSAAQLDAVNTIVVDGERLIGHNTDLPAIEHEITQLLRLGAAAPAGAPAGASHTYALTTHAITTGPTDPSHTHAAATAPTPASAASQTHAVVMGAGGASRAVQVALTNLGIPYTVVQRSDGSLQRIAGPLEQANLLVNTTPVGTGSGELPLDAALLRPDLAVFDLTYRPNPTALVAAARSNGAQAITGGGMLVEQGWRSLALWLASDGVTVGPEVVATMTAALEKELST